MIDALDDFDRVAREAAATCLVAVQAHLRNPLARERELTHPGMRAFLAKLVGLALEEHVAKNRIGQADADLRSFAQGGDDGGNVLGCYM